jgi:hypothetical protein
MGLCNCVSKLCKGRCFEVLGTWLQDYMYDAGKRCLVPTITRKPMMDDRVYLRKVRKESWLGTRVINNVHPGRSLA